MPERLSVLIIGPYLNRDGLGEGYSIFRWIEALSEKADLTVLTLGNPALPEQLPKARVEVWMPPRVLDIAPRLSHTLKPWMPVFFAQARRWIRRELAKGARFDIAHQVLPQAMRYATPLAGLGIPFVVGPLGGSLETPAAFRQEVEREGLLTRLRAMDRWRLRYDPWLRYGYESADLILGVAPYVGETLTGAGITVGQFEPVFERGYEGHAPEIKRTSGRGEAHLLHVGRAVRTKGLRDVIRALAMLSDLPGVHLTSAGDGPDLAACKAEAARLGVADRVTFLGRIPRAEVDRLYGEADVFCFPSFREPMGGVFFEAMEYGLPVIAANRGGPATILTDQCAIQLPVETPTAFATEIAMAIRRLADDPTLRRRLGAGALQRLQDIGNWNTRAETLSALYARVLEDRART